jgi:site-specific DNA-methyltransferase (adenine-specific)
MKPYYEDSSVTIYNADCRDVLPTLDKVDAVVTDPPYNAGKDYEVASDNLTEVEYHALMTDIASMCKGLSERQSWVAPRYQMLFWLGLFPKSHLIVVRRGASGVLRGGWADQFETVLVTGKPNRAVSDLWEGIRLKAEGYFFREETFGHPGYTPYPILSKSIALLSEPSETVLDPFSGTGTTLRAAKDLNRKAIGIEINESYCEITAKRMAQLAMKL